MQRRDEWVGMADEVGPVLAEHAGRHDREGTFVEEAFDVLRRRRAMSALVPAELGGGGASITEVCDMLRVLAHHCPSTSLAHSMHQHLVAAAVWKFLHAKAGEPMLRRVADEQLVLVSTGASDWVDSNGTMTKVDGGYRVSGRKVFGSGGPAADVIVTSSRYACPERGARVLHFPVPMKADGVSSAGDWDTLGMRGTGSHTLVLDDVFVPDEAIALDRPSGQWHPAWSVAATVALPILMSTYVGVAEAATAIARGAARARRASDPHADAAMGEVINALTATRLSWRDMVDNAADGDFEPTLARANEAIVRKTLCAQAAKRTVEAAMIAAGGRGFFRSLPLERCFRDVQAAHFHPLPEARQLVFSGRVALGVDPITEQPLEG